MTLLEWIDWKKLTVAKFASKIGISRSQVHKYLKEGAIPKPEVMHRIAIETEDNVTPNDIYGIGNRTVRAEENINYEDCDETK